MLMCPHESRLVTTGQPYRGPTLAPFEDLRDAVVAFETALSRRLARHDERLLRATYDTLSEGAKQRISFADWRVEVADRRCWQLESRLQMLAEAIDDDADAEMRLLSDLDVEEVVFEVKVWAVDVTWAAVTTGTKIIGIDRFSWLTPHLWIREGEWRSTRLWCTEEGQLAEETGLADLPEVFSPDVPAARYFWTLVDGVWRRADPSSDPLELL